MLFHQWISTHVQKLVLTAELFWLLLLAYLVSDGARSYVLDFLPLAIGCLILGGISVVGIIGHLLRHSQGRIRYILSLQWPLWWVREPILLAVALLIFITPVFFWARLAVSAPSLSQLAERIVSNDTTSEKVYSNHVGLFVIREVDHAGPAVRFITGRCALLDDCGIVYSPNGTPPVVGADTYRHIWGPWWHWHRSF